MVNDNRQVSPCLLYVSMHSQLILTPSSLPRYDPFTHVMHACSLTFYRVSLCVNNIVGYRVHTLLAIGSYISLSLIKTNNMHNCFLQYVRYGRNLTATVQRALEVANKVDSVSQKRQARSLF